MFISCKALGVKTYRYERKFLVENITPDEVRLAIKLHSYGFFPLFAPRYVNNIYFDTLGYNHYYDNVEGNQERIKIRIRWYGDLYGAIKKPVLEIKAKSGLTGTKYSFPLAPFTLDQQLTKEQMLSVFDASSLPDDVRNELESLRPALLNQYHRHYYLSDDKKFRLTVDAQLKYHSISYETPVSLQRSYDRRTVILEMKYDVGNEAAAREISTLFPFMLTKSSKYIQGLDRLYA